MRQTQRRLIRLRRPFHEFNYFNTLHLYRAHPACFTTVICANMLKQLSSARFSKKLISSPKSQPNRYFHRELARNCRVSIVHRRNPRRFYPVNVKCSDKKITTCNETIWLYWPVCINNCIVTKITKVSCHSRTAHKNWGWFDSSPVLHPPFALTRCKFTRAQFRLSHYLKRGRPALY